MSFPVSINTQAHTNLQSSENNEIENAHFFRSSSDFNNDTLNNSELNDADLKGAGKGRGQYPRGTSNSRPVSGKYCTANDSDPLCVNGKRTILPDGTYFVIGHGNASAGLMQDVPPSSNDYGLGPQPYFLTPQQLANDIKRNAGANFSQIKQVVIGSCSLALKDRGQYCQNLANLLGKDVWAPSDTIFIASNGAVSVYQDFGPSGSSEMNTTNPGRFIRFRPGEDVNKNSAILAALREKDSFPNGMLSADYEGIRPQDECYRQPSLGACLIPPVRSTRREEANRF
jgi:hypothetical protein